MTEKLEIPALDYEGIIFTGRHHAEAVECVYRTAICIEEGIRMVRMARIGFVTNAGRFVDFEEAERIAQQTGQALPWVVGGKPPPASPNPEQAPTRPTDTGSSAEDGFRFCPELFEHRASVIEALDAGGITWMTHFASVDLRHDDYGIEVCGIKSKEDASRVRRVLQQSFPAWSMGAIHFNDHDQAWWVEVRCCADSGA